MQLTRDLADRFLREHPERAALALEQHPVDGGVAALSRLPAEDAASVVRRLSTVRAAEIVAAMSSPRAAALLEALDLDHAARIARSLPAGARAAACAHVDPQRARALETLLAFPEGSAGALMDSEVLALPAELSVASALARLRNNPSHARYNLYVVDAEQRLVGVLNLRELLLAPPEQRLAQLMVERPLQLPATADRAAVVSHPGWKEVHALPVVDAAGRYLGAVRYRTLRELEDELLRGRQPDAASSRALGELLALGAAGAIDAFAGVAARNEKPRGR